MCPTGPLIKSKGGHGSNSEAHTIWVPHFAGESALGRVVGVVLGKCEPCIEEAALTGGAHGAEFQIQLQLKKHQQHAYRQEPS